MSRVKAAVVAETFEKRVQGLLRKCGFSDVGGGRGFRIGEQVDACAGYEDSLIIVECKTGPKKGKPLLDEIKLLRGKMASIEQAARRQPGYSKYSDIRYAIAANFDVRTIDEAEASKAPRVFLWDAAFLDHYEDLLDKVGDYARYGLLGELEVSPRVSSDVHLPSFRFSHGTAEIYVSMAAPSDLLKWAYVARREVGHEHYYQRLVHSSKLGQIVRYLDGGGFFPNAPILAFVHHSPDFKNFPDAGTHFPRWPKGLEFGCVKFPGLYRTCWIVDGQHRLYGAIRSTQRDALMPIVCLNRVPIEEQAQIFLDINKTQKPVPADLVWDLEGEMRPQTREGMISRTVKLLNESGPLAGRIYIPFAGKKRKQQVRFAGLCRAISRWGLMSPVLQDRVGNPFFKPHPDDAIRLLSGSLKLALAELDFISEDWHRVGFWHQNSGLAVFVAVFAKIASHRRLGPTRADYRKYLEPLRPHLDTYGNIGGLRTLRRRCSSEAGRTEVLADFVRLIRKGTGERDFAPGIAESDLEDRIKVVERGLGRLLNRILAEGDEEKFRARIPGDILERARKRMPARPPCGLDAFLTLGELGQVIAFADNWDVLFEERAVHEVFRSRQDCLAAIETVGKLRAGLVHGRGDLTEEDERILDGYLMKLERTIKPVPGRQASSQPTAPNSD